MKALIEKIIAALFAKALSSLIIGVDFMLSPYIKKFELDYATLTKIFQNVIEITDVGVVTYEAFGEYTQAQMQDVSTAFLVIISTSLEASGFGPYITNGQMATLLEGVAARHATVVTP